MEHGRPGGRGRRPFGITSGAPLAIFSSRTLRTRRRHVHTRADPFLFVHGDALYLFFEVREVGRPGHIEAVRTTDLIRFDPIGTILSGPTHFSYPLVFADVFSDDARVHMLPESSAAGEVALYTFADFPHGLERTRTLLKGDYVDTSLLYHANRWWFFTTSPRGLEIFSAADLVADLVPHPANPITSDPRRQRCGGPIIERHGALYRPAQDGSEQYGGNLSLMRIDRLDVDAYVESLARENIFDRAVALRSLGAHHLGIAEVRGRTVIAVDGKQADHRVHRIASLLFRPFA